MATKTARTKNDLPKIGAPATRALAATGITSLKQVSLWREEDLAQLHGMGPKALDILKKALKENGLAFKSGKPKTKAQNSKASKSRPANSKAAKTKTAKSKPTDAGQVEAFMKKLEHPLKEEIEAVRKIIKGNDKTISERIKWNAPSYHTFGQDFVTFNPRALQHVHLVFHHPYIIDIKSDLLEGDYKDRRMMYFKDMNAVKAGKKELDRIIGKMVKKLKK